MNGRHGSRASTYLIIAGLVIAALLALPPQSDVAQAQPEGPSRTVVVDGSERTPSEFSVALSQASTPDGAEEVVIARDDDFADALASGVLQQNRPLLLVPGQDRLPEVVATEIARLGATTAVILGGPVAVGADVVGDLTTLGLEVERIFGQDRIATAIELADTLPSVDTVMVARAYAVPGNPTSGFADTLAAGAVAAERGWPILLTDSDTLSPRTRTALERLGTANVMIIGGTAAISDAVQAEIETFTTTSRISGTNRFGTAVEIAKATSDGPVNAITLVEGTASDAWVGGFAAASLAAVKDAPVVLGAPGRVPPETQAFLESDVAPQVATGSQDAVFCVITDVACELGRRESGLPARPLITVDPPDEAFAAEGDTVTVSVDPPDLAAGRTLVVTECLAGSDDFDVSIEVPLDDAGTAQLEVPAYDPDFGFCASSFTVAFANGESTQAFRQFRAPSTNPTPFFPVLVFPDVKDPRNPYYPVPFRTQATCEDATVGGDRDVYGLSSRRDFVEARSIANTVYDNGDEFFEAELPRNAGRCQVSVTATTPGVTVTDWEIMGPASNAEPVARGSGDTAVIDVSTYEPVFQGLSVRFYVRVATSVEAAPAWTGPVGDTAHVALRYQYSGLDCDDGTDAAGSALVQVTAGAQCTASPLEGAEVVRLLRLGQSPTYAPTHTFVADPAMGPVGVEAQLPGPE